MIGIIVFESYYIAGYNILSFVSAKYIRNYTRKCFWHFKYFTFESKYFLTSFKSFEPDEDIIDKILVKWYTNIITYSSMTWITIYN